MSDVSAIRVETEDSPVRGIFALDAHDQTFVASPSPFMGAASGDMLVRHGSQARRDSFEPAPATSTSALSNVRAGELDDLREALRAVVMSARPASEGSDGGVALAQLRAAFDRARGVAAEFLQEDALVRALDDCASSQGGALLTWQLLLAARLGKVERTEQLASAGVATGLLDRTAVAEALVQCGCVVNDPCCRATRLALLRPITGWLGGVATERALRLGSSPAHYGDPSNGVPWQRWRPHPAFCGPPWQSAWR